MNLRHLPAMDRLLREPALADLRTRLGTPRVKAALRELQDGWRRRGSAPDWAGDSSAYAAALAETLPAAGYRPVFNLTGTVIHTNLGRSLLDDALLDAVRPLLTRPVALEYDLDRGRRGDRDQPVEDRLRALTGAEAATVVNNNAAALMLALNTFGLNRPVPVSRGELVEIGGSFRLPEIMTRAGCRLREVGTTNRTHAQDFADAIDRDTGLVLKVHPSNFYVSGFTASVGVAELAAIAHRHELPLLVDLGSGSLVDLQRYGLPHEPTPQEILAQGADLVTFSGDKLLGGVQAGLIVGGERWIRQIKSNPMKRALRPDKITLTLLDAVLACYDDPATLAERLPLLRSLTLPLEVLDARGNALRPTLAARWPDLDIDLCDSPAQIGSGALPDRTLPSRALRVRRPAGGEGPSLEDLGHRLRALPTPVIGRIQHDALWLDLRGADPLDELLTVLEALPAP